MDPITVIGTGLAGYNTAKELRKHDPDAPLRLISADDGAAYSKPMLSNAVARGKTAAQLVQGDADAMAAQLNAELRSAVTVTGVDSERCRLSLGDEELGYSKLVLAVGADPIRLPLQGSGAERLLSVNDLADYARFRSALQGCRRVAILGAGLIGCEFANDLALGGYQVELIDLAPLPLGRLVPPEVGAAMQQALAGLGVGWHLGTSVERVDAVGEAGRRVALTLANGDALEADLLLSAVGLRPRTALAVAAGLEVNRGILVDPFLRTSDDRIYALGDCAEVAGLVLPFVLPIMHASRALARTLAGRPTEVHYPALPVAVKTPALPVVVCPPLPGVAGDWRAEGDGSDLRALFVDADGALRGFALTGAAVAEKGALAGRLPNWS